LPCIVAKKVIFGWRAVLLIATPAGGARRRADPVGPRSAVPRDGATGRRVTDASIMPTVGQANTHLTTVMIAKKMADEIRREMKRADCPLAVGQPGGHERSPNSDGTSSRREKRIDRSLFESCRGQPFRPHESGRGRREHFVDPSSMAGPLTAQASLLAVFGPKGHRQSCRDSQSPHPLEPFLDVVPERVLFTPGGQNGIADQANVTQGNREPLADDGMVMPSRAVATP
jgi:hypothetical protein